MNFLSTLDGKTIFAGAMVLFGVVILLKGMNTKAGGSGGSSNSSSSSSSSSSTTNSDGNN
jgi:hypothetical protein